MRCMLKENSICTNTIHILANLIRHQATGATFTGAPRGSVFFACQLCSGGRLGHDRLRPMVELARVSSSLVMLACRSVA